MRLIRLACHDRDHRGGNPERMLVTSEALWVSDGTRARPRASIFDLKVNRKQIRGLERPFSVVEGDGF
jgi:hypothetical protein